MAYGMHFVNLRYLVSRSIKLELNKSVKRKITHKTEKKTKTNNNTYNKTLF